MQLRGIMYGLQTGLLAVIAVMLLATPVLPLFAQGPPDDGSRSGQFQNRPIAGPDDGLRGSGTTGGTGDSILTPPSGNSGSGGATGGSTGVPIQDGPGMPNFQDPTVTTETNTQTIQIREPEGVVEQVVYFTAVSVSGYVIRAGGWIFDIAFQSFVLQLGCWFVDGCAQAEVGDAMLLGNGQVGGVVNQLWQMVRDIFNIIFIFALIYIGIRTILFTDDNNTRRMIGMLIAAALLINFSLYFAKTIVDFANFTAVQLHQNLNTTPGSGATSVTSNSTSTVDIGFAEGSIAGHVMSVLEFANIFQAEVGGAETGQIIMYSVMMLVFSLILGFTFAYAGLMLLFRFMALVFYLIFSPFMFLSWVVPQFKTYGSKWWNGFLGYAFYAPVFMFFTYISLFTISALSAAGFENSAGFAGTFASTYEPSALNTVVFFVIAIGFIIASTKVADTVAKQSGAIGMSAVSKFSKRVTTGAGAVAGGYVASYGTGAIGTATEKLGDKLPGRWGGTTLSGAGRKLQKTSIAGASSFKDREDAYKEHNKKRTQARLDADLRSSITAGTARGATAPERTAMESALRDASSTQIVTLAQSSSGIAALETAARTGSIPQNKIDAVINSKDVDETNRQRLRAAAEQGARNRMNNNQNGIAGLAGGDLTTLDFEQDLLPNAMNLSSSQMQNLRNAWQQNQTQSLQRLENERERQFDDAIQNNRYDDIVNNRNDSEIAQLPNNVISDPGFVTYLAQNNRISNRVLTQIATRPGAVNTSLIGNTLMQYYTNPNNNVNMPQDVQSFFNSPMGGQFQ